MSNSTQKTQIGTQGKVLSLPPPDASMVEWALYYRSIGMAVTATHKPLFNAEDSHGKPTICTCEEWRRYVGNEWTPPDPNYVCDSAGKHPKVRTKKILAATEDTIRSWFKWPANVGALAGHSGRVVIDGDVYNADGDDQLDGADLDTQIVDTGGGGFHLHYRMPEGLVLNNSDRGLPDWVNVRGDGGFVVLPPSKHKSGKPYSWREGHSPADIELAELPPKILEAILESKGEGFVLPAGTVPVNKRHETMVRLAGYLRHIGLGEEAIRAALVEFVKNQVERPADKRQITQTEIDRLVDGIMQKPGGPLPEVDQSSEPLGVISASELLAQPDAPLEYLPLLGKSGYIVRGWSTLITGHGKAGKTELITASFHKWTKEKVLVITEEPQSVWKQRMKTLGGSWDHVSFAYGAGAGLKRVIPTLQVNDYTVVVIDTARSILMIKDQNDNGEVASALVPLIAEVLFLGKTPILIHHLNKSGGERGLAVSGATAWVTSVDTAIEVGYEGASKYRRKISGISRIIDIEDVIYEQDPETKLLRIVGAPKDVTMIEVTERAYAELTEEWQTTKQIWEAMKDEHRTQPSQRTVRDALGALIVDGRAVRDPAEAKPGATYKYRLPTVLSVSDTNTIINAWVEGEPGLT